jgi:translocation and assembly module TamB
VADPHGTPGADHPGRRRRDTPGDTSQVALVPDDPNKLRWGRGIVVGIACILFLAILAGGAVLILSSTDWGHERVRRYAQTLINDQIHGTARIGRISGNLLTGITVHNFSIVDTAGSPFVAVESMRANYSVMSLVRKHIWIRDIVAVRPLIVLDKPATKGVPWNWQRIFKRDTTPKPASQQTGWGDWLRFTNATIEGGQLIVRTPWHPSERLGPTARDSAIREALAGGGRLMIQKANGGYQKIVQLDSIWANIPMLRLNEPGAKNRLLEVAALRMKAYPFRPPAADVRDLKGSFPFNNDSVWWKGAYAQLPESKATGDGSYVFDSGDMTMTLHAEPASFADMRWVYPRLPGNGRGKLDLELRWRGAMQDYQVSNADITMDRAHALGAIGITLADTLTIHDTNLRFSGVDTRTLEQLIPGFKSPRRGLLAGRAIVSGGRHALTLNTDITFDDQRAGRSRLIAIGDVGFPGRGVRASNLRLQMLPVQVELARQWMPNDFPLGGTIRGSATVNGNTARELVISANLDHNDRGAESSIAGKGTIRLAASGKPEWFDIDVVTRPVSLIEVGRFFPAAGLHGSASGPVHLTGTLANLRVDADLRLPDGGRFTTRGTMDVASTEKAYDLTARLYTLNLRTITTKGPVTSLTAQAMARGRGFKPETMRSTFAVDLSTSRYDSVAVDTASIRANIGGGLADIQKLYARGGHVVANVSGTFGLAANRTGELSYTLAVDSLGAFNRWIPGAKSSQPVQPRPGLVARAFQRARADSARRDRATEIERVVNGSAPPTLIVNQPKPVAADTISGSAYAAGRLRGNIHDFDLKGSIGGEDVVVRGNYVKQFTGLYDWTNARSPQSKLVAAIDADSVSAMGFAFDTVNARLTYAKPGGHVELAVVQDNKRQYGARGDFALYPDRKELRLADMTFQFDTTFWSMPHPGTVQWGGPGIRVTDFELRNRRGTGRIYASGLLPTDGVADFRLDVDDFPVANIVDITQTDIDIAGVLTLHGTMTGTLKSPSFRGAFGLVNGTYNGTKVPDSRGRFGYADQQLVAHLDAMRLTGQPMATVDARLPINLALSGVTGDRLLPEPMTVDLVADSLPLELIPQFTDVVSDVHGHASGKVALRGTLRRPALVGALTWTRGEMTLVSTGAHIESIGASLRMANDTVYVDSVAGWAKGPVRLRGSLAVGNWREPSFNLYLVTEGAELMNSRKYGKVRVDAGVSLTGPFREAYVSGAATVTQGVIYAPDPTGRHLIGAGDPALYNVLDTAVVSDRELFPLQSPFLANMRMELTLSVRHDTWVRNREAHVEIYTDDPLFIRAEQQAFALTGVVTTDRGEYNFMSKRFQIKRGSAMFVGTPDLNPTLQITGEYQITTPSRGAVNIDVLIGGTLRKPRLSLESDAQPPKTQSELLSLLAFGQSTTNLLSSGASSIAGGAGTSDLFGAGAQMAVKRLAGVAMGVAVDQIELQAGRAFGTDVFDITPADVPSGNIVGNLFMQTKFEAGKYVNPRTFVSAQIQANQPGIAIDHRTRDGWRFNVSFEPRLILREPKLNEQPVRTVRSYGGFIVREWRF